MPDHKLLQGILVLVDVVNFTGQANRLGDKYTADYSQYFQDKIKEIVSRNGFQVIKSMGDAILFFGTDPAGLLEIMLDLYRRDKPENKHGFTSKFRLVAHSGFFQFQVEKDRPIDLVSPEGIMVFRMEKLAQSWELAVTQPLYLGVKSLLTSYSIEASRLPIAEPLKGFDSEEWDFAFYRLKIAQQQTGAANLLEQRLDELENNVQTIPVFGNIYPPVSMENNFINLRLDHDDPRHARVFDRKISRAGALEKSAENDKKQSLKKDGLYHENDREVPEKIDRFDVPTLYDKYHKAIIFGLPGAGKTTILRHMAHREFEANKKIRADKKKRLVLFVPCKDAPLYDDWYKERHGASSVMPGWQEALSFMTWVFLFGNTKVSDLPPDRLVEFQHAEQRVEAAFKERRLTLFLDALDEGASPNIRQRLKQLFYALYSENRLYLTSRPSEQVHLKQEPGKELPVFKVLNLDMEQVRAMAKHILNEDSPIYNKFDTALWQEEVVVRMAATPITALLITAYFQVYEKFDHRYPMYDLILKFILLKAWESMKSGAFPYQNMALFFQEVGKPGFLDTHTDTRILYDALAALCFELFYKSADGRVQRTVNDDTLLLYFTRFIKEKDHYKDEKTAKAEAANWKERFFRDHLLLQAGTSEYVFVHSTVMEFLAAYHLVQQAENDNKRLAELVRECLKSEAFLGLETLPLAAGSALVRGFDILTALRDMPADYNRDFVFDQAVKCLVEVEWLLEKTLTGIRLRSLRKSILDLVQRNRSALAWAYTYLKELVLSADKEALTTSLRSFEQHLRLCRDTFLNEYLGYEASISGDAELAALRKQLLAKLVLPNVLETWLASQEKAKRKRENIFEYDNILRLDTPGYHPEDKNFNYYKNITGPELAGFFGSPNLKHGDHVTCVVFSPDGKYIASGSSDHTLRLWEAATGKEVRVFTGHRDMVLSAEYSPDGRHLVSGSADRTLRLWDAATGKELRVFKGHGGTVFSAAFSPDGQYIISGSEDRTLRLWQSASIKEVRVFTGHRGWVRCAAFSPDGQYLVSGSSDKTLRLWDAATGKDVRAFSGHRDWILSAVFSFDGKYIASGSYDRTLHLWDAATGKALRVFKGHGGPVRSSIFSPDGQYIASGSSDNTLCLWEASSGKKVHTFTGHGGPVWSAAFLPDGRYIVSGSEDKTLRLWKAATGKEVCAFTGHGGAVRSLVFSPDGKYIASGSEDETLRLWETATGKLVRAFEGHLGSVWSAAVSPDGKYIASGAEDRTLLLWDTASGREVRTFTGHRGPVWSVAFSPDGKTIVSGSEDKTLCLWDAFTGDNLRAFKRHEGPVWSAAFSPDGKTIVSGSEDKTLRLWDAATGEQIRVYTGHKGPVLIAAFSPDGKAIVSGSSNHTLRLWEAATGKHVYALKGHQKSVWSAAFSPDGKHIISCSEDRTLRIWDIMIGRCIKTISLPWVPYDIKTVPGKPGMFVTANSNFTLTLFDLGKHLD